jgi:hypothetical protein
MMALVRRGWAFNNPPGADTRSNGFAFDLVLSDPSVAEQSSERIVIGVSQMDQTGDAIPGPESVVVRLVFRVLETGTTEISFEGSTGSNPTDDPAAADSSGNPIGAIVFDQVPATVIGR